MPPSLVRVVLLLALASCRAKPDPVAALEDRLFAPCCWRQTLRDHESPTATRLRAEITERSAAGETTAAIERDLVARYGENIRALPSGEDPRWMIGAVFGSVACAGLALLIVVIRRRKPPAPTSPTVTPPEDPDDAERLDDALALVD